MFIITGKKYGIVWDAKNNKPLIKFTDGKATTEDLKIAEKLQKLGYKVEGLPDDNKQVKTDTDNAGSKPTQKRTYTKKTS